MQYLLSEEEYAALSAPKPVAVPEQELAAYLKRLPHFGPCTVRVLLECLAEDGLAVVRMTSLSTGEP